MKYISTSQKVIVALICFLVFSFSPDVKADAEVSLSKKAEITGITGGYNVIKQTYKILNSGSEAFTELILQDDIGNLFPSSIASVTNYDVQIVNTAGGAVLLRNASYNGLNNLLAAGNSMPAGSSAEITLTYRVKLTAGYDGRNFAKAAAVEAFYDNSSQSIIYYSVDGDVPKPDPIPDDLTEIKLRQITIEGPAEISVSENPSKTVTYTISSKGEAFSQIKAVFKPTGNAATLSNAAGPNVDAWATGGTFSAGTITYTLNFNPSHTTETLVINIEDDNIYELDEYFVLELTAVDNNISLLQSSVKTKITSDDPLPVVTITDSNGMSKYDEGTTPSTSTTLTLNVSLSNGHYLPFNVPIGYTNTATESGKPAKFIGTLPASISFPAGTTKQSFNIVVNNDDVEENDINFTVGIGSVSATYAKAGSPSVVSYQIKDDDWRYINWLQSDKAPTKGRLTPLSRSEKIHAGVNDTDSVEIFFAVSSGILNSPEIKVEMPAGVTFVAGSVVNLPTSGGSTNFVNVSWVSGTNVLVFKPVGNLKVNDVIHFKFARKASCGISGSKTDKVTVSSLQGSTRTAVNDVLLPQATQAVKSYNYNVYIGNPFFDITLNKILIFPSEGDVRTQKVKIQNNGQGNIENLTVEVLFEGSIANQSFMEPPTNITIDGYAVPAGQVTMLTFPTPPSPARFKGFVVKLGANELRQIGNKDNILSLNESFVLSYDLTPRSKAAMRADGITCGEKSQTVNLYWDCKAYPGTPAQTTKNVLHLYLPDGVPLLTRGLVAPTMLNEDGVTPNIYTVKYTNDGGAPAFDLQVPLSILTTAQNASGQVIEYLKDKNSVVVKLNGTTLTEGTHYTLTLSGPAGRYSKATFLLKDATNIPVGESLEITYSILREKADRYTGKTIDVLGENYFHYIRTEQSYYNDECKNNRTPVGVIYFNSPNAISSFTNIPHIPSATVRTFPLADMSDDPGTNIQGAYSVIFEDPSTVFPIFENRNLFNNGTNKGEIIITVKVDNGVTPLPQPEVYLTDFVWTNDVGGASVKFSANDVTIVGKASDGTTYTTASGFSVNRPVEYIITIPGTKLTASHFKKNAKIAIQVEASCGGGNINRKNTIDYTIDYKTGYGNLHKLYKASTITWVKCKNEPGANLKPKYFKYYRKNVIKGDKNNDGIDGGTADTDTTGLTKIMNLDRFYENDTLHIQSVFRIAQDPQCDPSNCPNTSGSIPINWNYFYVTLKNLGTEPLTPSNFEHVKTTISTHRKTGGTYTPVIVTKDISSLLQQANNQAYFEISINALQSGAVLANNDSVIVISEWRFKPGNGTTTSQRKQYTAQIDFWGYTYHGARPSTYSKFDPLTDGVEYCSDAACIPTGQADARSTITTDLYTIVGYTDDTGIFTFTRNHYMTPLNMRFYHVLDIGIRQPNGKNFLYELRQPYYVSNMVFDAAHPIPYGYIAGKSNMKYFGVDGNTITGDTYYRLRNTGRYDYLITPATLKGYTIPPITLGNSEWMTNVRSGTPTQTAKPWQVPEEGWLSRPYIPLVLSPRAKAGADTIILNTTYKNPPNTNALIDLNIKPRAYVINHAANFVLQQSDTTDAFNDTIRWTIFVKNPSPKEDANECWIYMQDDDNNTNGIKPLYLIDENGNKVYTNGTSGGKGYQGRWLKVTNTLQAGKIRYYTLVAVYDKYSCDRVDSALLTPWFDYSNTSLTPLTTYTSKALNITDDVNDPNFEPRIGNSIKLYVRNYEAQISGSITPLTETPVNPQYPRRDGNYGDNGDTDIQMGVEFPVEMAFSSSELVGIQNVHFKINIPEGFSYVQNSAYYQWGQDTLKIRNAAEALMMGFNGLQTGPIDISLKDMAGRDSISGVYNSSPENTNVFLRFKLLPSCDGFNADSIYLSAQLFANHYCGGKPAFGNSDTIVGSRVYLRGHRYYKLDDELYAPSGADFGFCTGGAASTKRTINFRFTRIGGGEMQNDSILIKLPKYFHLDPDSPDPVRYGTVNPSDNGVPNTLDPIGPSDIKIDNTSDPDSTIIKWMVPRNYAKQYITNLQVGYEIDLELDASFPQWQYKFEQVAKGYIVSGSNPSCGAANNKREVLAVDSLTLYVYTQQVGLAKEVSKTLSADKRWFDVTYTYTIKNYTNTELTNIQLSDDLLTMFHGMVDIKDFAISYSALTPGDTLAIDSTYLGSGNIISSGSLSAKDSIQVYLTFKAGPNVKYDGRKFKNNAEIIAYNLLGCRTEDKSNWGYAPDYTRAGAPDNDDVTPIEPADAADGDSDPANNGYMTPIKFSTIRFKQYPGQYLVNENYLLDDPSVSPTRTDNWLEIIVERVGDLSAYSVDLSFGTDTIYLPLYKEAILGTSQDYCVDAQPTPPLQTLQFAQGEKETSVKIEIVDDKIREPLEAFISRIFNVQGSLEEVSLVNDTVSVIITDNDPRPTVSITAVKDSIKEGTILPAPGYGCTNMQFAIKLTNPTYEKVIVEWATTGGTAIGGTSGTPGIDYVSKTETVTFTLGCSASDTIQLVNVCVIADSVPEIAKTIIAGLTVKTPLTVRAGTLNATCTIVDDDIKIDTLKLRHLTCKGDGSGMIVIKARGGETRASNGKYHYKWSGSGGFSAAHFTAGNDTVRNLQAGVYSVTVSDVWSNPTDTTFFIEVKEPAVPFAIKIDKITNVTCNKGSDGEIETTISGGWDSPNYVIAWTKENSAFTAATDDIASLTAGKYFITVKDSAKCTVKDSVDITEPLPLKVSAAVIHNVTCKGSADGSISLTITGGQPFPAPNEPYFITWTGPSINPGNNGKADVSGLAPGKYDVTIMDNYSCSRIDTSFMIKEPAISLAANVDSITNVACKGDATGAATIKATGGWGQYTYEWCDGLTTNDPVRNGMHAGDYCVAIVDSAGCSFDLASVIIDEPAEKMVVTLTVTDETYQNGNDGTITVNVTGGDPAYIYAWNDAPALNSNFRNHLEAGTYTVEVTDQWNCVIRETAVIDEPKTVDNLPNVFTPDGDGFNDKLLEGFHIKVFDRWGYLLYEGTDGWDGRHKGKIMPAGTYFYVFIDDTTGKEYKSSVLLQITR